MTDDGPGFIEDTPLELLDIFVTDEAGQVTLTFQTTGGDGSLDDFGVILTPEQAREVGSHLFKAGARAGG